jgi:hypothetical protein
LIFSFREFDLHAARIIDKCFTQNEQLALQILTTKSKLYFDYSPLSLATEASSRSFLATKCVQKYLDQLWYGNIVEHGYHKIYMNIMVCYIEFDRCLHIDCCRYSYYVFFLFLYRFLVFIQYSDHHQLRKKCKFGKEIIFRKVLFDDS